MKSIMTDIFQGQTYSSVLCGECNFNHISFENFMALSLLLPRSSSKITHSTTLKNCFDEYVKTEKIPQSEGYSCSACKSEVEIMKRTVIWRFPSVLIINLKRFYCSTWKKEKLETLIEFPLKGLTLSAYKGESSKTLHFR